MFLENKFTGCFIGLAIGDAYGASYEGDAYGASYEGDAYGVVAN